LICFIRFTYHRRQYDKAEQHYQQVVGEVSVSEQIVRTGCCGVGGTFDSVIAGRGRVHREPLK